MNNDSRIINTLSRAQIDDVAWNACVAAAPNRIVYGYSWYLDAVLPAPDWRWIGLVAPDEAGRYVAVMPIPLRRKVVLGFTYAWVVHQPLFCQLLAVFSLDDSIDPTLFLRLMHQQFRYGAIIHLTSCPDSWPDSIIVRQTVTHVLDLSVGYELIVQRYTRDRKLNLRRAVAANWTVIDATDPEPLLALFRDNHAASIPGGVGSWAYALFRGLFGTLQKNGLVTLRYALRNDQIEAGALFVREGNRIIYLFNAASEMGQRGNARTLLIDQIIQEHAGQTVLFDFESPEKPSVVAFYRSFGAVAIPFWAVHWNRLTTPEKIVRAISNGINSARIKTVNGW